MVHVLPEDIMSWGPGNLVPLAELVNSAPIVAIGEAMHTSDGFYRAKIQCFKYLIEHHGYRRVAFETPWGEARAVNAFILKGEGAAQDAIRGLFRVWQSTSILEFVQWLREFNERNQNDPVSFFGFDIQQPPFDRRTLREFLSRHAFSDEADEFERYCVALLGPETIDYHSFSTSDFVKKMNSGERQIDRSMSEEFVSWLEGIERKYESVIDGGPAVDVRVSFHTLRTFVRYFTDVNWSKAEKDSSYFARAFTTRDEGMAEVFARERRQDSRRTLIWAHNWHIVKPCPRTGRHTGSFGEFMRRAYGETYKAVALTANAMKINWPWLTWLKGPQSHRGESLETALMTRFGRPCLVASTHSENWFAQTRVLSFDLEYERLADHFDGALFIPDSAPIEYVHKPH